MSGFLANFMPVFKKLTAVDKKSLHRINYLLPQLSASSKKLLPADLKKIAKDKNTILFVVQDRGIIVGMGTVVFILTPVGLRARMEDVVIDEKYRRRGLGAKLIRQLIGEARNRKARWIEFTSRTDRMATNRFYRRLGFKRRDTNVYRLWLGKR